jgi:long-chain fatty acid transport protein
MRKARFLGLSALAACLLLAPASSFGAGFALFEHGARAVALGGAFGATADDPTALYYNPAGIAFQNGTSFAVGAYFITESSTFSGDNPYPGAGYSVDMKKQIFYPPHAYITGELTKDLHWGIGMFAPFGLGTWWPNDYAGKYISKRVDLKVFDINPNLSYKLSDNFAVAVGVDYFYSNLNLTRSIGVVNPYTQQVAEVGQVHMYTDFTGGFGWNAALLAKLEGGVSVGASYRSKVKINYTGNASFLQFPSGYADFDAIVATQVPFGKQPTAKTGVDYPSEARLALAWHGSKVGIEGDVVKQGWSSFKDLPITLPDYPLLSSVRYEGYKDCYAYRLGFEYKSSPEWAFQLGVLYDKTPVPTESVSPLLPDADRKGISIGTTFALSPKTDLQIGYLYLRFSDRSTLGVNPNPDGYEGTYKTTANLLGFTLVHRF